MGRTWSFTPLGSSAETSKSSKQRSLQRSRMQEGVSSDPCKLSQPTPKTRPCSRFFFPSSARSGVGVTASTRFSPSTSSSYTRSQRTEISGLVEGSHSIFQKSYFMHEGRYSSASFGRRTTRKLGFTSKPYLPITNRSKNDPP